MQNFSTSGAGHFAMMMGKVEQLTSVPAVLYSSGVQQWCTAVVYSHGVQLPYVRLWLGRDHAGSSQCCTHVVLMFQGRDHASHSSV